MKIFKNKFLVKLIATICVFLTLMNFGATSTVYAEEEEIWGGVLINPIVKLLAAIGDLIMEILHDSIQSQDAAFIKISGSLEWYEKFGSAVAVILGIAALVGFVAVVGAITGGVGAAVAALVAKEGAKAAFIATVAANASGILVGGGIAGIMAGVAVKDKMIPDDIYLPVFSISAEEIFSNEIALFDVNFFKPNVYKYEDNDIMTISNVTYEIPNDDKDTANANKSQIESFYRANSSNGNGITNKEITSSVISSLSVLFDSLNSKLEDDEKISDGSGHYLQMSYNYSNSGTSMSSVTSYYTYTVTILKDGEKLYTINYKFTSTAGAGSLSTSESDTIEISKEKVSIVENTREIESTAAQLQEIVSTWYFILRNIALLVLMLILIYTGIKIVIGSTAGEKAKYKERLMDWLVAVCLIFVMHYIMVFAVELVQKITKLVGETVNGNMAYIELTEEQATNAEKIEELKNFNTIGDAYNKDKKQGKGAIAYYEADKQTQIGEYGALMWPTDLAGLFRIQSQITEDGTTLWAGYTFCYVVLVLFTLFFAFTYLRRVLYMAFLTMIAPLVAMTYPIDKITDGKAQAFDSWLKEYIFNLMIQPLHLLLYTILVTSAYTLATESPLYAIVAIGFMIPAEKLMRRFFGFEKAKTPGLLGGAAGVALAMTGMQKLFGHGPKGKGGSNAYSKTEKESEQVFKVKKETGSAIDTLLGTPDLENVEDKAQIPSLHSKVLSGATDEPKQKGINFENDDEAEVEPGGGERHSYNGMTSAEMMRELQKARQKEVEAEVEPDERGSSQTKVKPIKKSLTPEERARMQGQKEGQKLREEKKKQEEEAQKAQQKAREDAQKAQQKAREDAQQKAREEQAKKEAEAQKELERKMEERKLTNRVRRVRKGVAGTYARGLKQKAYKRVQNARPIESLVKAFVGAEEAILLAGLGAAMGTVTGEAGKVGQYASVGGGVGWKSGTGQASAVMDTFSISPSEIKDEIEMSWYGSDYAEHKYEEAEEEDIMSEKNINYYRQVTGASREEAVEFLDTTGREYYEEKITDVGDMLAIENTVNDEGNKDEKGKEIITKKEAIAAMRLKKSLPQNVKDMSYKKRNEYFETYSKSYQDKLKKKNPGWEKDEKLQTKIENVANRKAADTIRIMETLETQKSKLTEI